VVVSRAPVEIELHIDELVVGGVPARDGERVAAALTEALGALVLRHAETGGFAAGGHTPRVDGGRLDAGATGDARRLGAALAGAIFRSVSS
jgi:hypothetical protein